MNNYYDYPYPHQQKLPTTTQSSGYDPNQMIINSYDGFIRGNLFANLYQPYTNQEPWPLSAQNEQETLMQKVMEYEFAMIDLQLYLDVHPDDQEKIKFYDDATNMYLQAKSDYEQKYGPITNTSQSLNTTPWSWPQKPWPWEVS